MTIPLACPECGSPLCVTEATAVREYHPGYHVRFTPLPTREEETVIAACSGCEFIYELTRAERNLFHLSKRES